MRKIKQTGKITSELKQKINEINNEFIQNVKNKKKPKIEKVENDIIKMNKIIQRRYIKERMEKNVNEEKKEGDFVYKSEVSDLNNNNILNLNEEQNTSISNKNLENQKVKENEEEKSKENRYLNM